MSKTERSPEIPIELPDGVWLLISMQKDDPVLAVAGCVEKKKLFYWFTIPPAYALFQIGIPRKTPRLRVHRCLEVPGLYDVAVPMRKGLETIRKECAKWKEKEGNREMKE